MKKVFVVLGIFVFLFTFTNCIGEKITNYPSPGEKSCDPGEGTIGGQKVASTSSKSVKNLGDEETIAAISTTEQKAVIKDITKSILKSKRIKTQLAAYDTFKSDNDIAGMQKAIVVADVLGDTAEPRVGPLVAEVGTVPFDKAVGKDISVILESEGAKKKQKMLAVKSCDPAVDIEIAKSATEKKKGAGCSVAVFMESEGAAKQKNNVVAYRGKESKSAVVEDQKRLAVRSGQKRGAGSSVLAKAEGMKSKAPRIGPLMAWKGHGVKKGAGCITQCAEAMGKEKGVIVIDVAKSGTTKENGESGTGPKIAAMSAGEDAKHQKSKVVAEISELHGKKKGAGSQTQKVARISGIHSKQKGVIVIDVADNDLFKKGTGSETQKVAVELGDRKKGAGSQTQKVAEASTSSVKNLGDAREVAGILGSNGKDSGHNVEGMQRVVAKSILKKEVTDLNQKEINELHGEKSCDPAVDIEIAKSATEKKKGAHGWNKSKMLARISGIHSAQKVTFDGG